MAPQGVRVISAFQNVGAAALADLSHEVDCDIIVCGDDKASRESVKPLVEAIPGCRYVDGGLLANSRPKQFVDFQNDVTAADIALAAREGYRSIEHVKRYTSISTANDQGKSFGLDAAPEAIERNVGVIRAGHETRLDVGTIRAAGAPEPEYFFDSAGWGLSARVLAQRNKDRALVDGLGPLKEIYRDQAVYAGAFLKTFLESYVIDDKLTVHAVLDGEAVELDGLTDLIVKNTRVYAGAWILDDDAKHDDGVFEIVPFQGKRDWASKAIIDLEGNPVTEKMLNELGVEHSRNYRAKTMDLTFVAPEGGAPLAAQIDGEEWPADPHVRIEVAARAIRLIVP
jgi:diacylglycerol kinase family enzyme